MRSSNIISDSYSYYVGSEENCFGIYEAEFFAIYWRLHLPTSQSEAMAQQRLRTSTFTLIARPRYRLYSQQAQTDRPNISSSR